MSRASLGEPATTGEAARTDNAGHCSSLKGINSCPTHCVSNQPAAAATSAPGAEERCLAGFVVAFTFAVAGLVVSIVARREWSGPGSRWRRRLRRQPRDVVVGADVSAQTAR